MPNPLARKWGNSGNMGEMTNGYSASPPYLLGGRKLRKYGKWGNELVHSAWPTFYQICDNPKDILDCAAWTFNWGNIMFQQCQSGLVGVNLDIIPGSCLWEDPSPHNFNSDSSNPSPLPLPSSSPSPSSSSHRQMFRVWSHRENQCNSCILLWKLMQYIYWRFLSWNA